MTYSATRSNPKQVGKSLVGMNDDLGIIISSSYCPYSMEYISI
jgi:hypothetical protein